MDSRTSAASLLPYPNASATLAAPKAAYVDKRIAGERRSRFETLFIHYPP
jgi:hypothetical protein